MINQWIEMPAEIDVRAEAFLTFCKTIPDIGLAQLRHCRDIESAMATPYFYAAGTLGVWPPTQDDGLAAVLICLAWTRMQGGGNGFVRRWGIHAKRISGKPHINELRFVKLLQADEWPPFFDAALVGVRKLMQEDHQVDLMDLVRLFLFRAETWAQDETDSTFSAVAGDMFYREQLRK